MSLTSLARVPRVSIEALAQPGPSHTDARVGALYRLMRQVYRVCLVSPGRTFGAFPCENHGNSSITVIICHIYDMNMFSSILQITIQIEVQIIMQIGIQINE